MSDAESIVFAALEKPASAERNAYVAEACGGDAELRQRVERLLAAAPQVGSFLDQPADAAFTGAYAPDPNASEPPPGDNLPVGTVVAGRFKVLEQIGEGGMGTVYVAEQTAPVRRKVALKLVKPGMDSRSVLARFEAERQALALMDHPNIAKVLDGGLTAEGRPFFVMEYIKGVPLTAYCDAARLNVRQRLELFAAVCQAVQHAHQKGIIHRDLKPSNVLVARYDGKPVPKVIDFGLAKAMHQPLTERSLYTGHQQVLGTPLYMSPEQSELNNLDVDTRTDIYSLGVILYELLTGTTPLDRQRFRQAAWDEMLRLIREEEPPRPSTRLSTSDALPSVAASRQTEPAKLTKLVRGDLDWIVMKALEKDRGRRYATANGLARDVERYLADEAVEACPPSAAYRLRKFVRRNKGRVVAASLVLLALAGGIVGTSLGLIEARRQEARVVAEANEKEAARLAEADQRRVAEKRLAQVEKANAILTDIFRDLNPRDARAGQASLRELLGRHLDRAAHQLEGEAVGDSLAVARLQMQLASSLRELGHLDRAVALGAKALRTLEDVQGPDHAEALAAANNLAEALNAAGQTPKAILLLERVTNKLAATLGPGHEHTLTSQLDLGLAYQNAGRLDEAIRTLEGVWGRAATAFGADEPRTLFVAVNLAGIYRYAGRAAEGAAILERVRDRQAVALPADHADVLITLHNLAGCYRALGRTGEAIALLELVADRRAKTLGADHVDTLASQNNLAGCYGDAGRWAEAVTLYEKKLALSRDKLGQDHPDTLITMNNLAGAYVAVGNPGRAVPLSREYAAATRRTSGPESPQYAAALAGLGLNLLAQNHWAEAEPVLRESLAIRTKSQPAAWTTYNVQSMLGGSLLGQGKYADAEPLLTAGYGGMRRHMAAIPPGAQIRLADAAGRLVQLYEAWGKPDDAAKWLDELWALAER